MKIDISDHLTTANAVRLAILLGCSPLVQDSVHKSRTPGIEVLNDLEHRGILGERKVDQLEEALEDIDLSQAAVYVKQYKENMPAEQARQRRGSESSLASEDSGIAALGGSHSLLSASFGEISLGPEDGRPPEAFCNRCNVELTWQTAAKEHFSHIKDDVISGDKLPFEILRKKHEINQELDDIVEKMRQAEKFVAEECPDGTSEKIAEVERLAAEFCEKVEKQKKRLLNALVLSQQDMASRVDGYRKSVREMTGMCESLKQEMVAAQGEEGGSVRQLKHLNDVKCMLQDKRYNVNTQLKGIQESRAREFLRSTPNDGQFAELLDSTLAGTVWILEDQLVMVFDERSTHGHIELKCFAGPDADKESWSKFIEVPPGGSDVVVSPIEYYVGHHPHILLAAGASVYMLQLSYNGYHYDGIYDTKSNELDMDPNSYVTSICAHEQGSQGKGMFVISSNTSLSVKQYDSRCNLIREIPCSQYVSSIFSVSCVDDVIAVVDNLIGHVVLIHCESNVTSLIATLTPPVSDTPVVPWVVLWTGALWLVLWVPQRENTLKWWITSHEENGHEICLYDGVFTRMSFPVAISRFIYGIVICFSDATIQKVEQVK